MLNEISFQTLSKALPIYDFYSGVELLSGWNYLILGGLTSIKCMKTLSCKSLGDKLKITDDVDIKEAIAKSVELEKLEKEIAVLEIRIRKEKQFNVQVRLNGELRKLKEKLEGLK